MALVVSTLQADLQATFLAMNDITDGSGDRFGIFFFFCSLQQGV